MKNKYKNLLLTFLGGAYLTFKGKTASASKKQAYFDKVDPKSIKELNKTLNIADSIGRLLEQDSIKEDLKKVASLANTKKSLSNAISNTAQQLNFGQQPELKQTLSQKKTNSNIPKFKFDRV